MMMMTTRRREDDDDDDDDDENEVPERSLALFHTCDEKVDSAKEKRVADSMRVGKEGNEGDDWDQIEVKEVINEAVFLRVVSAAFNTTS